jgi:hypothetical protein
MDTPKFGAAPIPVNVATVHEYTKAVKAAKLTAEFYMSTASKKAKDLLADCCTKEHLPTTVPPFLAIHDAAENPAFILLRPTMTEGDNTIPVIVTKRDIKIDLTKLLLAKNIGTVPGARLVIPVSSTTINTWGSALVLHMGALDYVAIKKRKAAETDSPDESQDDKEA